MRTFLSIFLLLAPLALAGDAPRPPFPDDYKPQPCAPKDICSSVPRAQFSGLAKLRGYTLPQEWVVTHWDELMRLMHPVCEKVANCQTVPGNHWVWCKDVLTDDFTNACSAFADETDRERCRYFTAVFFVGQDEPTRLSHPAAQKCATEQNAGKPERTLEYWMLPAKLPFGFDGRITIHAIDAETRIPVMAHVTIDASRFSPVDSIDGTPITGYVQQYRLRMKHVSRADGHRDVVPPIITLTAPGYRTETFALPVEESEMILEMSPKTLKRGKTVVTITARDSITGKPVDARVMGDDRVLGKTNRPFVVEWKKGQPSPEIWVTSLYDIYDDAVVFPKTK